MALEKSGARSRQKKASARGAAAKRSRRTYDKPQDRLRYSVSLVTQGNHRFYTLTMPSSVLKRTCFVTTRYDDPQEGFQRTLERSRGQEIASYIDEGMGTIPNSIVLSAQPEADLKVVGRGKTLEFNDTPKAFLILDGQHRVYGFSLAKTDLRVPVVIYNDLSREDETRLFIDINTKQRPVPNALLLDIRRLAEYQSEHEAFLYELFDHFHQLPDSPLLGHLSKSETKIGKISRVTFNAAMRSLLGLFEDRTSLEMYAILRPYLKVWSDGLKDKTSTIITKSVVFRAIMGLFPTIIQRVQDRHGTVYTAETFASILTPDYMKRIRPKLRGNVGNSVRECQTWLAKALQRSVTL